MRKLSARILAALIIASLVALPFVATYAAGVGRNINDCGSSVITVADRGSSDGIAQVSILFQPLPGARVISYAYTIEWINWSPFSGFRFGAFYDTKDATPTANSVSEFYNVVTGPGDVTVMATGIAPLFNGVSCSVGPASAGTFISGTVNGTTYNSIDLGVPVTADLDNNNKADQKVCGNSCDKHRDQLDEANMEALYRKVCANIDNDNRAFKACKQSGNRVVYDNHGSRDFNCWYRGDTSGDGNENTGWHGNRNGWVMPVSPDNAPDGYIGKYQSCGHGLPTPTRTPSVTQTPAPVYNDCTIPQNGTTILCDVTQGEVHVLTTVDHARTHETPVPTPVPYCVANPNQCSE